MMFARISRFGPRSFRTWARLQSWAHCGKPSSNNADKSLNNVDAIVQKTFKNCIGGHRVFVILPYIKWGPQKPVITTPELQLQEAVSLVNTLEDWTVVETQMVPLLSMQRKEFFGTGKVAELRDKIRSSDCMTAVFISRNMLTPAQHEFLELEFGIPVYDRYLIVMQIFREHAVSAEAKLQIALAEIPYIYSRMSYSHSTSVGRLNEGGTQNASVAAINSLPETRKMVLRERERKLKSQIEKLREQRQTCRDNRKKRQQPVVAVVGYTNAGKTSLIKALTGKEKLQPKDCLFATLDVTFHAGILPCNMEVSYVDTIGFISDIPAHLIEPFTVTLSDAMNAHVIVVVQDASHPDAKLQQEQVMKTLDQLKLDPKLRGRLITVANKTDLLDEKMGEERGVKEFLKFLPQDTIFVSCADGRGIPQLKARLEKELLNATGRFKMTVRTKTGGPETRWLQREASVVEITADPKDYNYSLVKVILTDLTLTKFKNEFVNK